MEGDLRLNSKGLKGEVLLQNKYLVDNGSGNQDLHEFLEKHEQEKEINKQRKLNAQRKRKNENDSRQPRKYGGDSRRDGRVRGYGCSIYKKSSQSSFDRRAQNFYGDVGKKFVDGKVYDKQGKLKRPALKINNQKKMLWSQPDSKNPSEEVHMVKFITESGKLCKLKFKQGPKPEGWENRTEVSKKNYINKTVNNIQMKIDKLLITKNRKFFKIGSYHSFKKYKELANKGDLKNPVISKDMQEILELVISEKFVIVNMRINVMKPGKLTKQEILKARKMKMLAEKEKKNDEE